MDPATKGTVIFGRNDKDMLYYFTGTQNADHVNNPLALSLTTSPVTLDINIAHDGLLGHPDTKAVTAMAKEHGWALTISVQPCGSCVLAKACAKAIPKSTIKKLNQNKYWLKIVDDYTRYSWDCFLTRKSGIQVPLFKLIQTNKKAAGKPCKYLRCDNAGENESYVQQLCTENNIQLEMTAPDTPQMNITRWRVLHRHFFCTLVSV